MKKRFIAVLIALVLTLTISISAFAQGPGGKNPRGQCNSIASGEIFSSTGEQLVPGYDVYGYNYQAHIFNGTYDSADRNIDGTYWGMTGDWVNDQLVMKWSDNWLANVDCNGDGVLDRGLQKDGSVTGYSMGWTTNHVFGDYADFIKIVFVGLGQGDLWGSYTIVQGVEPGEGVYYMHPELGPGLGFGPQQ